MNKNNQRGALNVLLIPLVLVIILLIVAVVFAFSTYSKEQDYKNNVDQKVAAAVKDANAKQKAADAKIYADKARKPLKTYVGPADFGSVKIKYPKDWSIYVQTGDDSTPVDGYGQPNVIKSSANSYIPSALRFQVVSDSYSNVVSDYQSQAESGEVKVHTYKPKNIKGVTGVVVTGQINENVNGKMIILPLRNMTFKIYTESSKYVNLFDKYILPNFSFKP